MKLGETLTHNGIEAVLVEGTECTQCYFNYVEANCPEEGLLKLCLADTLNDDDGIFKQVEPKEKEETNELGSS